ncbi:MAG TPA: DnaJ domain-containing protein [Dehalococcoidia bacterium]|nr:DnaJ domain-containing protein [Dehalococcoidia bacterium]
MRLRLPLTAIAIGALALVTAGIAPRELRAQQTPEDQAVVTIDGPSRVSPSADSVQLEIHAKGVSDLAGFQFVLSFDSNLLKYVSVDKTDFLGGTGRQIVCQDPTVDTGAVRLACVTLGREPPGVEGDGTLAVVTLKPSNHGTSGLGLSRVKLVHPDGSEIPSRSVDGRLTVGGSGGSAVPWWAVVLIAVAVIVVVVGGVLVWQRRRPDPTDSWQELPRPNGTRGARAEGQTGEPHGERDDSDIDPYELLGVRPDAPMDVVEASYRALVRQHHPDRNQNDVDAALRMTKRLNAAIERIRGERKERTQA